MHVFCLRMVHRERGEASLTQRSCAIINCDALMMTCIQLRPAVQLLCLRYEDGKVEVEVVGRSSFEAANRRRSSEQKVRVLAAAP